MWEATQACESIRCDIIPEILNTKTIDLTPIHHRYRVDLWMISQWKTPWNPTTEENISRWQPSLYVTETPWNASRDLKLSIRMPDINRENGIIISTNIKLQANTDMVGSILNFINPCGVTTLHLLVVLHAVRSARFVKHAFPERLLATVAKKIVINCLWVISAVAGGRLCS